MFYLRHILMVQFELSVNAPQAIDSEQNTNNLKKNAKIILILLMNANRDLFVCLFIYVYYL